MGKAAQTAEKIAELQEQIWELENSLANDPAWGRAEIVQDIAESRWLDVQNDYRNGWLSIVETCRTVLNEPCGFGTK